MKSKAKYFHQSPIRGRAGMDGAKLNLFDTPAIFDSPVKRWRA